MKAVSGNILLIDNNDSFTYNIIDLLRKLDCANFQVVRSASLTVDQLDAFSHLIISPGPGLPGDFPVLREVIAYAEAQSVPLLGVCLGHQAVCEYFGGEMIQLEEVIHGRQSEVRIDNKATLHQGLPANVVVARYHSWAIARSTLPSKILVTGVSEEGCLMSIQHDSLPIFSVQYHPESFLTNYGDRLIHNFIQL